MPNGKLAQFLASLAAHDRVADITYHDSGLRTARINTVTYSSATYPSSDVVKTVYHLGVGTLNQRIDKIEWVGGVFGGDSLRKVFTYALVGIKYVKTEQHYELF